MSTNFLEELGCIMKRNSEQVTKERTAVMKDEKWTFEGKNRIILREVQSSNISAIGYDEPSNTLFVEFHGGALYEYTDFPKDLFEAFKVSPSKGKFFHSMVKGKFTYERLT